MNTKLLALFGLKFNPFSPEIPTVALWSSPAMESFCWRIEQQVGEGGFALVMGDTGTGKSATLRLLAERLGNLREVTVGILTRPQASLSDFYRELGALFGVPLAPSNRWASAKVLREKWHRHLETSLYRPILLVDEAQEMNLPVFSELRLLASADLDSRSILTVILAGDARLGAKLGTPELLPLASRIRSRFRAEPWPPAQLRDGLNHVLKTAGNPKLMTPGLLQTLCEHAAGNPRLLMNMAHDLLAAAWHQEREQLDEKLFFEVFALDPKPTPKRP
jgi:type II secretory pathway predicted ATPase ExeA